MEKYYTTGAFAKKAGTTQRTIRYYDKIGILKPSLIMENGYRKYSEKDVFRLQRIISLRYFGFSLEEILPMLVDDSEESFKNSLSMQIDLVNKKITHLQTLKDSLKKVNKLLEQGTIQWDRIADLIKLTNVENRLIEQYKDNNNLKIRIQLHENYSVNTVGWFTWVYQQIDFSKVNRLLEIGCGSGNLWQSSKINLRHREIFLTDRSNNMIEEAKKRLGNEFNYMVMDGEDITFKKEYFDTVIANHVLFYFKELEQGIAEILRVLHDGGMFYCSAYGKNHMKEIQEIVYGYDNRIELVEDSLFEKFGLENGHQILQNHFSKVELRLYDDYLKIRDTQLLVEYILSCPGNQIEIIGSRLLDFKKYIEDRIKEAGYIRVTKQTGIFICKK